MKLSVIVITKNAADKLEKCLLSCRFADEILVVDSGSTDDTIKIARDYRAKIISVNAQGFAASRNIGHKEAKGEWLLYVDADERISQNLAREILRQVTSNKTQAISFRIYRKNLILGKWLRHGGWWPDPVHRLIKKKALSRWQGKLHEQPIAAGRVGLIKEPLIHQSKDSISEMVRNTRQFAPIEARLMMEAGHPRVRVYHFLLAMWRSFWYRGIRKMGWRDGLIGVIEIIYQMFHQVIVYSVLWQMQKEDENESGN